MLATAISIETRNESKPFVYLCQVKSKGQLDPSDIFIRILAALDAKNAPEAARILGISKQAVYDWQKNTPGIDNLFKISQARNTSLHWLLTGEGERFADAVSQVGIEDVIEHKIRQIVREELEAGLGGIGPFEKADIMLARDLGKVGGGEMKEEKKRKAG